MKFLALIDEVKKICNRLVNGDSGWRDLLLEFNIDITSNNLRDELQKPVQLQNQEIPPGFEDFSIDDAQGIKSGDPAKSLLYHSLASPNVKKRLDGITDLSVFPTFTEIEVVENYVYGVNAPSMNTIRNLAGQYNMAIVVFAYEYRPGPETVHRKHADMCFSRTGVARVGTTNMLYDEKERGFLPFVENDDNAMRVLPSRYAAFLSVQLDGSFGSFGPMNSQPEDSDRKFWVPLHKLFNGNECISDLESELHVELSSNHINEKLKRIHLELEGTGWGFPDIDEPPFVFTTGIAEFLDDKNFPKGLLVPVPHDHLVESVKYNGKTLSFNVPPFGQLLSSSLLIPSEDDDAGNPTWRHAPEYVHVRHKVVADNQDHLNLNESPNIQTEIQKGNYQAKHYVDFTGDGWINAQCPELAIEIPRNISCYSLVTAPDFFPNCDQRELMEWWLQKVPRSLRDMTWRITPLTLSDERISPNLELSGAHFRSEDKTATSIVSHPIPREQTTNLDVGDTRRHTFLPDAASGVFQPGWDITVSRLRTSDRTEFLAAYGLGSPFPEDAKLCAALSAFWPGASPDAARTFEPDFSWPTVCPLTDTEIGQLGNSSWDGAKGPSRIEIDNQVFIEYDKMDYVDYIDNALENKFSLSLTGKIDTKEYKSRVLSMAKVYKTMNLTSQTRGLWSLFSFTKLSVSDSISKEIMNEHSNVLLQDSIYRFDLYRPDQERLAVENNHKKIRIPILENRVFVLDPTNIFEENRVMGNWIPHDNQF